MSQKEKCEATAPDFMKCPRGAIHDTEITELKRRMKAIEEAVLDIRNVLIEKLAGRPTWSVSIMITVLTTACASMAVYILTKL